MAIFKTLKSLISRSSKRNFNYSSPKTLTLSLSSPCPLPPTYLQPNYINIRRQFLFRSRFPFPLGGPLFLSNAPWNLSQSATPLFLQSDVVTNFLKLRALNLLQKRGFPNSVGHEYKAPKQGGEGSNGNEFTPDSERGGGPVIGGLSDSYLNLPNCISFARMLSGPFLGWMIAHDLYSYAFVGLAISGASDWLDGYVARKMGINSVVGSYLDPLADKVLIGCVALSMVDKGLLHPGLVALVLFRDVGLVGGAVYKRATSLDWKRNTWRDFFNLDQAHVQKVKPLFISKVNTVFQLALVAVALLQPDFGNGDTLIYINYLSWLVASTTVASTAAYGAQHLKSSAVAMKSTKFGK